MKENEITGVIVDAAFEVHRELDAAFEVHRELGGPGLLEAVPMFPSESLRLRVSASLR